MTSLSVAEEYFSDLRVLLSNCDRPVLDDVDKDLLQELKDKKADLDRHEKSLKSAVDELEWGSEDQREEYITEMEEAFQTLSTGLSRIDVDGGVPEDLANDMRDAARVLSEDTAGLMEDL